MPPTYTVAVRTLCEFTAKAGDLDRRFTPSATALEGRVGHAVVAARRGAASKAELSLAASYGRLVVRGRADGFDAARARLEEVKTFRGELARMPANRRALHWAQVKVYGALLCRQERVATLTLALVYFDVATQTETVLEEVHTAAELQTFFAACCERFVAWADQEIAHRAARDADLGALAFPHAAFRPGQRPLAEAVYRAATAGRCLIAEAPTGIGKTVGTLFPLLKACPGERLDKVFFLSAKTPGRGVALQAMARIAAAGADGPLPLRVLELVARDTACEHPGAACHGDACPLARGFYDRLPAARAEALAPGPIDRARLRAAGLAHDVCPYHLGQELVRWADVIVGDYNHWFDASALLHGMTLANDWRVGVLVDEAHNLLPRARAMYSAELGPAQRDAAAAVAPAAVAVTLGRLRRVWTDLARRQETAYAPLDGLPPPLDAALQAFVAAMADHLAATVAEPPAPALLRFFFDALQFTRLADSFGAHSIVDLTRGDVADAESGSTLCLRNLVPAHFLAPRFAAARSTTLFSATLSPMQFHADLLGVPADAARVEVESPFAAAQLAVRIHAGVSTRFADRAASLAPIVALIAAQHAEAPGNYLAFFSSFDYLRQAVAAFRERHPQVPVWEQSPRMDEAARAAFLDRFVADDRGCGGIGFAVLGGAFAEGIDLAGRRLIGAFVATLGLPQVNPVNEALRERMEAMFPGRGHDYAYLYPGLQRVVQAAGRVIRTLDDRGSLHLIDARFDRPDVRALLPRWWALPARQGWRIVRRGTPAPPSLPEQARGPDPV